MTTLKKIVPIFALALCIVLCFALAACDDTPPEPETTQYTVTFVYGGDTANEIVKVDENSQVTKPQDPEREGYEFAGWKQEGASVAFDFDTKITNDITLVAQWNEVVNTARIRWSDDEAVTFVFAGTTPKNVAVGTLVEFGLRVSPYYVGEVKVYAGSKECTLGANGKYSFTVEKSVTVSVEGLRYDDAKIKGLGNAKSPYLISNAAQLKAFADSINAGEDKYAKAFVALTADIDFNGETIEPIGGQKTYFQGEFDGRGHVVSNFNLDGDEGIAGFFGYIATATIKNLTIDSDIEVEAINKQYNYILGGIVAYNMGGDIVNCNFKGSYTVTGSLPDDNIVYLGGIVGFMQGYGTEYTATASFCSVQADLVSNGQSSLYAIGGIAAATYGPANSSSAYVNNCSFVGNVEGRNKYAGGIVGYLRSDSAVANCYVDGKIEARSGGDASYAGGIVGASDNEAAISSSVAIGTLSSSKQIGEDEVSDISGLIFRKGFNEIDTRKAVLFKAYYTQDGIVTDGKTYSANSLADLSELLGWVVADWKEEDGAILPVYSDTATGNVNVKFVFGRNVTKEDSDGNPLTQSEDTVTITDVVPIYYIYGGSGMNNFVADKEGADDTKNMVSYGYFFDAACTQRIPSSFLITSDITVYVGFADYSEVEGDYYAVLQTLKNNEIYNAELHLIFDNNGKMTMYYDGIIADYMYVYNGEKLLVKDAYFAYIAYTTTSGYSLLADYYADIDGNVLNIYDNLFFTSEKNNVIVARKQNAAMGTWYTSDGATYTFLSDLTGSRTNANVTETFTYSCNDNVVTITIGSTRIIASITSDGMSMKSISAGLELEKRDIFAGKWESSFNRIETITFDGKGNVTYKGTTYEYVLDGEKATFGSIVATFDENGLLVVKDGEVSTTYGRDGSFIGTWTDTFLNYTIVYVGMFGYCTRATITNLTLEDVCYSVVSGADKNDIGAYVGGLVAFGNLTNITNVKVSGEIKLSLCASNPAHVGGIAGGLNVYDKDTAYIAHVQNCVSEVKTVAEAFEDGDASVLDSVVNGGIVGATSSTSNGALAILNCVSNGSVEGGEWVGGIVGYASCSRMSVINCINYARVKATDKETSYAGGIVGYSSNDNTIMDCVNVGRVTATRATSNIYKSFAGAIAGYTVEDNYDGYYSAGIAIVNCYYKTAATTADKINATGTKVGTEVEFDADWLAQNVKWDMNDWSIDGNGKAVPGKRLVGEGSYKISLVSGSSVVKEETREYDEDKFAIVGVLDAEKNENGKLFFDWEFEDGVRYRYYVPVIKDMTVTARFGDASKVAHVYTGKGEYHGDVDGGVLVLKEDGTLMWVNSTVVNGKYTYNGDDVLMFEFYNTIGEISGRVNSNGTISMTVEYGMSATVEYTFTKSDLTVFGEYFNEDGDSLTFSDGNVTLNSNKISLNADKVAETYSKTIKGTYEIGADGNITFGGAIKDYFTSMSASYADDAITVTFVSKDESKAPSYENSVFGRPSSDFRGKPYVGSFSLSYLGISSNKATQNDYTLIFKEDGSFVYKTKYSESIGAYYSFKNDSLIKINYEGYYSTFYYYPEENVFFGRWNSGTTAYTYAVLTNKSEGAQTVYLIDFDTKSFVSVTETGKVYYVKDAQFIQDANIDAPDGFEDGARVTIDGKAYIAKKYVTYNNGKELIGHGLETIGSEEGTYTYNGKTFTLNGIGEIADDAKGHYWTYENDFVVVMFSDRTIIGFDYSQAQANGGQVTLVAPDKYQGIWCEDKIVKVLDKNLNETGETRLVKGYYLFILDGYGHAAYVYLSDEEKHEYKDNWGQANIWRTFTETSTGIHVEFNGSNIVDFVFYYDMNVAYVKKGFNGHDKEKFLYKYGYTGTMELPKLPTGAVGSYTGTESSGTAVVLNLKQDLTGTYKGNPFVAVYDGVKNVSFTISSIKYLFDVTTNTISYGSENVSLTRVGDVTEVIPEAICGTWSGTWTRSNSTSGTGNNIDLTIESDGTFVFDKNVRGIANYDAATNTVTVSCTYAEKPYVFTLKYNADTKSFGERYETEYDGSMYYYECDSLTKVTE